MATFTTSALTAAFVGGAEVFQKAVLDWDIRSLGVQVRTNVNTPQALSKFSVDGEPRPYRTQDDFNGGTFTDRVLTAYQSKYDQQLDSEDLRNLYLADLPEMPFENYAVEQAAKQYLAKIQSDTLWLGVRNAGGSTAAAICNGWGTIIATEITATTISPIVTGAITSANAVAKVELVANGVSTLMKQRGFRIFCSYDILEKYRSNYRSTYGFSFNKNERGQYQLDGVNAVLQPSSILGTSQRLVATIDGNLVFGTDTERLAMFPTPHLNILQNRIMFPAGCQIRDLEFLYVNDQA
jgi:hypothetical protein